MTAILAGIIGALITSVASGYFFIPFFRNIKTGVNSRFIPDRKTAPERSKTTGGAFIILVGVVFGVTIGTTIFVLTPSNVSSEFQVAKLVPCGVLAVLLLAVGYADDWLTDLKGLNVGLKSHHRIIALTISAIIFIMLYMVMSGERDTYVKIPFVSGQIRLGYFYVPVMTIIIVAVCESFRLLGNTEGCAGCTGIVMLISISLAAGITGSLEVVMIVMSIAAAICGFLAWNLPASLIKTGNAGKYLIAGLVISCCFINSSDGATLLVCAIPLVFLIAFPVDRLFYKITGNRIFGKLPVDEQLKTLKWSDYKILIFYSVFTAITGGLYVFSVYQSTIIH